MITKDLGFSDERRYPPGSHQGILVLRISDDRSSAAAQRLKGVFQMEAVQVERDGGFLGRRPDGALGMTARFKT